MITNYLERLIALENFNVETVHNGWQITIQGLQIDLENDWDEDPTEWLNLTLVTQDQTELLEVVQHLSLLQNAKERQ